MTPIATQTKSWYGSSWERPVLTKRPRAAPLATRPMSPQNNHAGKNAPNNSNDGAPAAEQPFNNTDAKIKMTNPRANFISFAVTTSERS